MMHERKGSRFLKGLGRFVRRSFTTLAFLVFVIWAMLALYYSNLPWSAGRQLLAAAFGVFAVWAFGLNRRSRWERAPGKLCMPAPAICCFKQLRVLLE